MAQMGRAREVVHADVWAVLGQAVDAAGGKAVTQRKMLSFLIDQLDLAATSSNVRSSTFKTLFAVQGNEVGCLPAQQSSQTNEIPVPAILVSILHDPSPTTGARALS